jgi:hypothetical protein
LIFLSLLEVAVEQAVGLMLLVQVEALVACVHPLLLLLEVLDILLLWVAVLLVVAVAVTVATLYLIQPLHLVAVVQIHMA